MPSILRLLALATLAALQCSLLPNTALANPAPHAFNGLNYARHNALAEKRRRAKGTCKHRPTSAAPSPTATASHKPSSTPKAASTNSGSNHTSGTSTSTGSPGKNGGSGKKGLAWDMGSTNSLTQNFNLPQISGMYTWTPDCPSQANQLHYPCFPMLWGGDQDRITEFNKVAARLDSEYYMGFNECNESGQCGMDPSQAASVWRANLAPLKSKHGKKLVCPVTSSNPNGFKWVQDFFGDCPDCECDILPLHFYDTTADKFKAYVQKWHNEWPHLPIWVTEFNCVNFNNDGKGQPSYSEVKAFFSEVVSWMDQQPYIQKYFAFGWSNPPGGGLSDYCGLVDSNLQPNELGSIFLN